MYDVSWPYAEQWSKAGQVTWRCVRNAPKPNGTRRDMPLYLCSLHCSWAERLHTLHTVGIVDIISALALCSYEYSVQTTHREEQTPKLASTQGRAAVVPGPRDTEIIPRYDNPCANSANAVIRDKK